MITVKKTKKSVIFFFTFVLFFLLFIQTQEYYKKQWPLYSEYGITNNFYEFENLLKNYNKNYYCTTIAIIDTGIDINHYALKDVFWINTSEILDNQDNDSNGYIDDINGWNFCTNTNQVDGYIDVMNENAHGTACAGIISANMNYSGITGITASLDSIKLMPLKVLSGTANNSGNIDSVIDAIHYAEKKGVKICNLSFNTTTYSEKLKNTLENSNMLFIVSAGNGNIFGKNVDKYVSYPASFHLDNIISVAATNDTGNLSPKSNYGKFTVDIAAPGEKILTTTVNNSYTFFSGTSFAAPYVTSIAAILYSLYPDATPQDIKHILLDTCPTSENLNEYIVNGKLLNADLVFKKILLEGVI